MADDVLQQLLAVLGGSPGLQLQPRQPLTAQDYAAFLQSQRPPLAPTGGREDGGFAPSPFDLPGESGTQRAAQPYGPLNLLQPPSGAAGPLALAGGGYSMGRAGKTSEPLNLQLQYSVPGLPLDLSAGGSVGRGGGLSNFMARYRVPF